MLNLSGKKVLLLNGGYSDIPLIEAASELGAYVVTTGNNPDHPGHALSNEYVKCDYRDREAILELAQRLEIDAICSCCNDEAMLTACYVSERLGLKGHDSYENSRIIHHKDLFKSFSLRHQVATPVAESFDNYDAATVDTATRVFPLVVKPVDQTGGYGISIVHDAAQYERAVKRALACSSRSAIVVEEYVQGDLCSFSTFIIAGKVVFGFSDQEYSLYNEFAVSTSAGPYRHIDRFRDTLVEQIERIADLLSLVDGLLHVQYIATEHSAHIIEITRRMSGDFYAYPVSHSCGLEWAKLVVLAEAGVLSKTPFSSRQQGYVGRHCIYPDNNGVLEQVDISDELEENIFDTRWFIEPGSRVDDRTSQKVGILFLTYTSREEMDYKTTNIRRLVSIRMREH